MVLLVRPTNAEELLDGLPAAMQRNAQKLQKRLTASPRTPAQTAADVVERVIATGGDNYLQTQQSVLCWWQLAMLDVKLALGLGILVVIGLLGFGLFLLTKVSNVLSRGTVRSMQGHSQFRSQPWKRKAL